MESMMHFIIEVYTDLFCTPREEYVEELKSIDSESEFCYFSDSNELRQSIEER